MRQYRRGVCPLSSEKTFDDDDVYSAGVSGRGVASVRATRALVYARCIASHAVQFAVLDRA